MPLVETILKQMSSVTKPQRKFMLTLLTALTYLPNRFNFRNLGRYTELHEKTFSRWFSRRFDFLAFNLLALQGVLQGAGERIVAIDASFVPKSGRKSYGLDWFWNGAHGRAERGQELSLLALVDVTSNTAYTLSTCQTPTLPKSKDKPAKSEKKRLKSEKPGVSPSLGQRSPHALTVTWDICGVTSTPYRHTVSVTSWLTVFTPRLSLSVGSGNSSFT